MGFVLPEATVQMKKKLVRRLSAILTIVLRKAERAVARAEGFLRRRKPAAEMGCLLFSCRAVIVWEMSELLSRITIDPEICHGKPAIRHLRYPVESMLEYLVAGDTFEDLLVEFPDLERDDLRACLEFAAQSLKLKSQHLALA
jgi:uncharacterized protein (DUF433 family)